MTLSIIIPVYKVQDTLERCIQSVLNQSFADYEIILVDDGSPDECPHICDEYTKRDTRISVIHKANGGLSDARNAGIKKAKGEYITFIDSDDAIEKDTLRLLMQELTAHPHIDILEYPVKERAGHPTQEKILSFQPKEYDNAVAYWLGEKAFNHTYACNKLYKRCLFEKVRFPKGKKFEDALTLPFLIGLLPVEKQDSSSKDMDVLHPKIRVTHAGMYLYHWNDKGITANAKYEDLFNLYQGHTLSLMHVCKYIEESGKEKEIMAQYHASVEEFMLKILNVLLDLYDLSGRYEMHPPLINRVKWLNDRIAPSSIKLKLFNILGYHQLCKLNHLLHKIYRHR